MKLTNLRNKNIISPYVESCFGFLQRAKGLLGRDSLPLDHSLWIKPCNNIHTLFMAFNIDIIFVDKNLKVVAETRNVSPWKPLLFQWNAHSVFEFAHLGDRKHWVVKGDHLYVDN